MSGLKRAGQVAALGLVALLLGLLVWKVVQNDRSNVAKDFTGGKRPMAVDFTLKRLNGDGSLKLSSLRGKVIVINFWASWCSPCKSEAPRFQAAFERYRNRVAFVGIDSTDYSGDARSFLTRYGVSYPNVKDSNGRVLHAVQRRYHRASAYVHRRTLRQSPRLHLRRGPRGRDRERDPGGARSVRLLAALALLALALCRLRRRVAFGSFAWPKTSSTRTASLADLEGEVMCPVCHTTLDQSSSPLARRIKAFISRRIAAGDSKSQIKERLVAEWGPEILAAPPKKGFDLLAWLLPIVGVLGGALALGALTWRWSRVREPVAAAPLLDPALERRIDQELARFDES